MWLLPEELLRMEIAQQQQWYEQQGQLFTMAVEGLAIAQTPETVQTLRGLERIEGRAAGVWPLQDLARLADGLLGGEAAGVAPRLVDVHDRERRRCRRDDLRHVRHCERLPPFQKVLSVKNGGDDGASNDLKSTWMLHLIHLGYRFEQIGGGFVIGILQPEMQRVDAPATQKASLRHKKHNRKFTRDTFLQWLHKTIPDERRMEKCEDFEASTD